MSRLLALLNKEFPTSEGLRLAFLERFGVHVRQEENLFQFKYDMIAAKWSQPIVMECRGTIVRLTNQGWRVVARPLDKFFNLEEGHCPLSKPDAFARVAPQLEAREKVDGACIQLWYDTEQERFRASSLGTITTEVMRPSSLTLGELFFQAASFDFDKLDRAITWIFELHTTHTPSITDYDEPQCVLLAGRHTESGDYLPPEDPRYQSALASAPQVRPPAHISLAPLQLLTHAQLRIWVESQAIADKIPGHWPEGYVLYLDRIPLAKVKTARYLQRLHIRSNNEDLGRKMVVESILTGSLDDLRAHLPAPLQTFADRVETKVQKDFENAQRALLELSGKSFENQRDYALAVQAKVARPFQGFFFQNRDPLAQDDPTLTDAFHAWIHMRRKNLSKTWVKWTHHCAPVSLVNTSDRKSTGNEYCTTVLLLAYVRWAHSICKARR